MKHCSTVGAHTHSAAFLTENRHRVGGADHGALLRLDSTGVAAFVTSQRLNKDQVVVLSSARRPRRDLPAILIPLSSRCRTARHNTLQGKRP